MKIAQLVNNLDVSGGYQKLVIRFSQQLAALGHEVTVYTPSVDKKQCYPKDIGTLRIVTLTKEEKELPHIEKFKTIAQKIDPTIDALVIHDDLSLLSLAHLPLSATYRIAWMLNNQIPERLGKYHSELAHTWRHAGGGTKAKLHASKQKWQEVRLMRRGLRRVDVFAAYDKLNQTLTKKILGRTAHFVAAGADLERFTAYAKGRSFEKKKRYKLLSVGVVFPHRRYEDVITAVAQLRKKDYDVTATIVGLQDMSPDYFTKLADLTAELRLGKYITFRHYVTDDEMTKLYKNSDAFLFVNDGFTWGISVFEAVAAGLPVIITNNIGAADLVEHGKTGWVVEPRSPKQVASAVQDMIDHHDKAKKIAQRATKDLTKFVSWEAYTKRMLDLLFPKKRPKK